MLERLTLGGTLTREQLMDGAAAIWLSSIYGITDVARAVTGDGMSHRDVTFDPQGVTLQRLALPRRRPTRSPGRAVDRSW